MLQFVLWYLAIRAVLDLGLALVVSIGGLSASDATNLDDDGGVLIFFVALVVAVIPLVVPSPITLNSISKKGEIPEQH